VNSETPMKIPNQVLHQTTRWLATMVALAVCHQRRRFPASAQTIKKWIAEETD
jgi:hypothetical protein